MAWYDDITYALDTESGLGKALPTSCCNAPSCQSIEPEFLQREPFIDSSPTKYTETDREWFAYRTVALKKWRLETSQQLWVNKGVERNMPPGLIMSDDCLAALAKSGGTLVDSDSLIKFLEPWYGLDKHCTEILACLDSTTSSTSVD